ncbi:MAG: DUF362 domain-containing protein [Candidatus Latescibacteria bacterium]|nr:DUF362 domain-containing protein [Candidatus Latescibacterota bacterium]
MKRRDFFPVAAGAAISSALTFDSFAQTAHRRDVSYEPDRSLESTGLRIRDGVEILKKGEQENVAPILRDEILENPDAVFIIIAGIKPVQDSDGNWKQCPDQMERLGHRVTSLVFRKGSVRGGRTFIKPNMVGGLGNPGSVADSHGGIVHPYLTVGMVDELRDIGITNVAISARGALRHPQVVSSGLDDLLKEHNLPFIEAHLQYFKDYYPDELLWHENPYGIVQRRFCTYKPAYMEGTTFINIAHAHVHKVGHTTLTLKNIQGIMPRGYGHICDAWTTLDVWRRDLMDDFNRNFRPEIEQNFIRHWNMGYKYWDEGGFYKTYLAAGGYDEFKKAFKIYEKSKGEKRQEALDKLIDIADTRIFWAEIWAQRMMDIVEAIPQPYVSMVDGVFGRGHDGVKHCDFITIGQNMTSVDSVTSWLMGQDPRELPYLRIANERGLGENDIAKIPIYILSEKGVEKIKDYRYLKRTYLGIYNYGLNEVGPRFF